MIDVENLSFSYTGKPFIADVSFSVRAGEIFGFLGPSGAGKSTLQKILTGALRGFGGSARVGGFDMRSPSAAFCENIGVDFEFPSLYGKLTARENIDFFASLYRAKPIPTDELLAMVDLSRDAEKKASAYSKGMKSRLNFAKALAHRPSILFLDEPTSGLDPVNARMMKDIILSERSKGRAIILTTHNMHDAAELCDRVAFIVDGTVRALDTPRNLIMSRGASTARYAWIGDDGREDSAETPMASLSRDSLLSGLIRDNRLVSIHSQEPSLEDVFARVTGRSLE